MDTVAGPGFCLGTAKPDTESTRVGALAADSRGTLWFESGDPAEGLLTKVASTASVPVLRTGIASLGRLARNAGSVRSPTSNHASASLLAPNRSGGLLLALPTVIVEHAEDFVPVAGATPGRGGEPASHQAGDGGPLREARFNQIAAIASDRAGNVYVADETDDDGEELTIRFLNRSDGPVTFYTGTANERTVAPGTIDTIAGGGSRPAGSLVAEAPGLAVAGDRLYLASTAAGPGRQSTVRLLNLGDDELAMNGMKVAPGTIATVATVTAADGAGSSPRVAAIGGVAADEEGNIFFAEPTNHRVRRVNGRGAITTFAGTGAAGFNGNDRRATEARLDRPYDVETGSGGRLYISDSGNEQVRVVDQDGTIRSALGNGTTNRWTCSDDAVPEEAGVPTRTGTPISMAADSGGNVYIANHGMAQIHRLAPSGSVGRVAGAPPCGAPGRCPAAGDEAPPKEATLGALGALKPGPRGGLYVMEQSRVRFLNPAPHTVIVHGVSVPSGTIRTVAGAPAPEGLGPPPPPAPVGLPSGPPSTTPDGEPAVAEAPGVVYSGVASDGKGNLFLGATPPGFFLGGNGSVRVVDRRGIITTVIEEAEYGADGTPDPDRCCTYPAGLVADQAGNLYVADSKGRRVWFLNRSAAPVVVHGVSVAAGALEPVAGAGNAGSEDPGIPALETRLSAPRGLALDGVGNLYIADFLGHTIRRVDTKGILTTAVGNGQPGFNGDGLKGPLAALNQPTDVAIDGCGNLLIADSGNDRVRRLNLATSCRGALRAESVRRLGHGRYLAVGVVIGSAAIGAAALLRRHRSPSRRERAR